MMIDDDLDPKERALLLRQAAEDAIAEQGKWELLANEAESDAATRLATEYEQVWSRKADEIRGELERFKAALEEGDDD